MMDKKFLFDSTQKVIVVFEREWKKRNFKHLHMVAHVVETGSAGVQKIDKAKDVNSTKNNYTK